MQLSQWIGKNFQVINQVGNEIQMVCPKCKGEVFYFNVQKAVGMCHKARCHWSPTIKELNAFIGKVSVRIDPEKVFLSPTGDLPDDIEISLPEGFQKLVDLNSGEFVSKLPSVVAEVEKRGVSIQDQYRFNIGFTGSRVIVPIYSGGRIVNYVGRAAWWMDLDIPRYEYPKGAPTKNYFFNWDECKLWTDIVLVENTFNAIWLRERLQCTTNFGSDLSRIQIHKLGMSKIKRVVLLWDKGTEKTGHKAVTRLRKLGLYATHVVLEKQPDDYSVEYLEERINKAKLTMDNYHNYEKN